MSFLIFCNLWTFLDFRDKSFNPHICLFLQARLPIRRCVSKHLWCFCQSTFLPCYLCFGLFLFALRKPVIPLKPSLSDCYLVLLLTGWDEMVKRREGETFFLWYGMLWRGQYFLMYIIITSPTRFFASGGKRPWHFLFCLFMAGKEEYSDCTKCQHICIGVVL